jgi:TPR repeat protein
MAETPSPIDQDALPRADRQRALVAARPTAADAASATPNGGTPTSDVPPLIEPLGFGGIAPPRDGGHARTLAAGRRPERQRFLAPVAGPAAPREPTRSRDVRPRSPSRPRLAVSPPVNQTVAAAPATALRQWTAAAPEPPARPLRGQRYITVGAAVTAVLILGIAAALLPVGEWVADARLALARQLVGAPSDSASIPTDPIRRAAYDTERAEAGDTAAQVALAILYAKGDGVAQDYAQAAKWFHAAAERGVARAQYDLGVLYEHGRGVPLDNGQAVGWYRKAAAQNHPLAQYNLAVAYTKAEGVGRDLEKAAEWYRRAALQGVIAAMVNLAILYERGEGVEASREDAYAWYRAAARRGSEPSEQRADELLGAFSPDEQTLAETKTAETGRSIHDAVGERTRLAAQTQAAQSQATPIRAAPAADEAAPVLKSGFDSNASPSNDGGSGNP